MRKCLRSKLSCQGSNLDSSDPESDVLPITPQDNVSFFLVVLSGFEPELFRTKI